MTLRKIEKKQPLPEQLHQDTDIDRMFKMADVNGNGLVSVGEILLFLSHNNSQMDFKKAFQVLQRYDKDRSGQLDQEEFANFYKEMFINKCANKTLTITKQYNGMQTQ